MESLHFLIFLGLFFLISQFSGRIANFLKAPRLIGYLLSGIVFGPYVLNVFSKPLVDKMALFTEMALSLIAFSIGASLKLKDVKKNKAVILTTTFIQALFAALLVGFALFAALSFAYPQKSPNEIITICILIGAIAAATAPAAILSMVHEYKAKGNLTNILLGVIAIDDAITIVLYAIALSAVNVILTNADFQFQSGIIEPFLSIAYAVLLGLAVGFFLKLIIKFFRDEGILLGIMLGAVFLIAGVALHFEISHLLAIMVFSFYFENFAEHGLAKKSYESIDKIEEPIFGIFFLLAGAHLNLNLALSAGFIVFVVIFVRAIGKYSGTWLAAKITGAEKNIQKYLGMALIPSAGVAIGLVLDAKNRFEGQVPMLANLMLSIIIGHTLVNELLSPFLVKYVLKKTGETEK